MTPPLRGCLLMWNELSEARNKVMANVKRGFYFFMGMALVMSLIPWMALADGGIPLKPEELKYAISDLQFVTDAAQKNQVRLDGLIFSECGAAAKSLDVRWTRIDKSTLSPIVLDPQKTFWACQKKFREKKESCENQNCVALSSLGASQFEHSMLGTEERSLQVTLASSNPNLLNSGYQKSSAIRPVTIEWKPEKDGKEKDPRDERVAKIKEKAAKAPFTAAGFRAVQDAGEELVKMKVINSQAARYASHRFLILALKSIEEGKCQKNDFPRVLDLLKAAKDFYRPSSISRKRTSSEDEERLGPTESELTALGESYIEACTIGENATSRGLEQASKHYQSLLAVCSTRCEDREELKALVGTSRFQSRLVKLDEIIASGQPASGLVYMNTSRNLYRELSNSFRPCSNPTAASWGNGTCNRLAESMNQLSLVEEKHREYSRKLAQEKQIAAQQARLDRQQGSLSSRRQAGLLLPGASSGLNSYRSASGMRDQRLAQMQLSGRADSLAPLSTRNMRLDPAASDPYRILVPGIDSEYSLSLNRFSGHNHLPGITERFQAMDRSAWTANAVSSEKEDEDLSTLFDAPNGAGKIFSN